MVAEESNREYSIPSVDHTSQMEAGHFSFDYYSQPPVRRPLAHHGQRSTTTPANPGTSSSNAATRANTDKHTARVNQSPKHKAEGAAVPWYWERRVLVEMLTIAFSTRTDESSFVGGVECFRGRDTTPGEIVADPPPSIESQYRALHEYERLNDLRCDTWARLLGVLFIFVAYASVVEPIRAAEIGVQDYDPMPFFPVQDRANVLPHGSSNKRLGAHDVPGRDKSIYDTKGIASLVAIAIRDSKRGRGGQMSSSFFGVSLSGSGNRFADNLTVWNRLGSRSDALGNMTVQLTLAPSLPHSPSKFVSPKVFESNVGQLAPCGARWYALLYLVEMEEIPVIPVQIRSPNSKEDWEDVEDGEDEV
ncbi:hypothetical protein K474DRAFT_1677826 [Panus rudis PR-1116 ss-1]|nr:hypothetical protein K474DRAFT_1677826 [Panus rudis PR-1116 ss-1]